MNEALKKDIEDLTKEELQRLLLEEVEKCDKLYEKNISLVDKINDALELIDSYNLGKYDYSIPLEGIIQLKNTLKGVTHNEKNNCNL